MSRTKSFSSTLTKICELAEQITILLNGAQDEYDKLALDSARLKEIEPALNRLQSALNPTKVSSEPPVESLSETPAGPPGEPPAEPASKPGKRHHSRQGVAANESDIPQS